MNPLQATFESLTAPDKEDWTIVVDGRDLYLTVVGDIDTAPHGLQVRGTVDEFKAGVATASLDMLGSLIIILPTDAEQRGATRLLAWLKDLAAKRPFVLASARITVPTDEAVAAWKSFPMHAQAYG
jgi:hypothetical protein